jgi:putative MATE family efflux protein
MRAHRALCAKAFHINQPRTAAGDHCVEVVGARMLKVRATAGVFPEERREHMTCTIAPLAPRTRLLLAAPVLSALLRLSAPNLAEALARVTFLTADAVFVSWLGSDALAAVSIVFPLLLMFQSSTASGFGAGVSASIGRALGAGAHERARALAGTAVALALTAAITTTAFFVLLGPTLYHGMGARGRTLDLAVRYGAVIFGGIGCVWLMNTLANIAQGAGNMLVPASGICLGEACHLLLSPALILGWGPVPPLGMVGAAVGVLSAYMIGAVVIGSYLCSRQALARIEMRRIRITAAETWAMLAIGAPTAAGVVVFWLTTVFTTGLIGHLGSAPLAAYGMATRLDAIQYPILFAFGSAVVAMVATAIGAGDRRRAARVAWTGCGIAALIAMGFTVIGICGQIWMRLFTSDRAIQATGALYLLCQAPVFPLFSAGIAAFFACTAAGVVRLPLIVTCIRLIVVVGGGWIVLALSGQGLAVFLAVAAGGSAYGLGMLVIVRQQFARDAAQT